MRGLGEKLSAMRLSVKLLIAYTVVGGIPLASIGHFAYASFRQEKLDTIHNGFTDQLRHVDWALTNFLLKVEYDVLTLVENGVVRTRGDGEFTSFLHAMKALSARILEPGLPDLSKLS
jgi:hypothetical protein